jgi:hypothetical protein
MKRFSDLLGATVAVADNLLIIALFIARLKGYPQFEYWIGLVLIGSIIPLTLLITSDLFFGRNGAFVVILFSIRTHDPISSGRTVPRLCSEN